MEDPRCAIHDEASTKIGRGIEIANENGRGMSAVVKEGAGVVTSTLASLRRGWISVALGEEAEVMISGMLIGCGRARGMSRARVGGDIPPVCRGIEDGLMME